MSGFGGVIKLKGEEAYKQALRDIRQSLRETGSSLAAISSSFQSNAKNMDVAAKSAKDLKDLFEQQKKAAESLKSVYDNLTKVFENNEKEIEKLKKEFESATKELEKIEKEIGKTSKAYKDQAEEVNKLEQNLEKAIKRQNDNKDALSKVRTELNNSETALYKTRGEWEKLDKEVEKNTKIINDSQSAYGNLKKTIEEQEKTLKNLKNEYKEVVLKEGETSKAAQALGKQISDLSGKLETNKTKLKGVDDAAEKVAKGFQNTSNQFQNALSKISGEFAKLDKAIENNKKTTERSKSAYENLKKIIEEQEGALKKLKDEYKEIILSEGTTSDAAKKLADQIKDLSSMLENNKKILSDVNKAADEVSGGIKDIGDSAEKSNSKFEIFTTALGNFISNIALKALGKLKEILVQTFNVGKAFEYSMSKIGAITGATGDNFKKLRDKAINMGKNTIFSAQESAEAMKYMGIAGWKTEEILAGIKPVLDLAAASGEDLAQVSDILTDGMTAFGMSAQGAGRFADVLTAAALNANTDVGKMGETFKYVAPIAHSLGYSIEDTATAIGLIADSGIKASQAGTDLRSIFSRLASNVGASKNQLGALDVLTQALGVAFYDSSGKTRPFIDVLNDARVAWQGLSQEEQVNYAKTIAGQKAMAGWLALMNTTPEKFNQVTDAIKNSSGTAQRVATEMTDNVEGDVKRLKSKVEGAQIDLSKAFEPETRDVLEWLQGMADVLQYIADHSTEFKAALVTIAAGVTTFIAATQGATIVTTLTSALKGLWGVLAANPIGAVVALVAGLVAGFIYLWNNSEEFRNFWINLWDTIKNAVEPVIKGISEWFSKAWEKVKEIWEPVGKFFEELFNDISETVTPIIDSIGNAFKEAWEFIKTIWEPFKPFFKELWETLKSWFGTVVEIIALPFKNAWEIIKLAWGTAVSFFKTIWNTIKVLFRAAVKILAEPFKLAWTAIKAVWSVVTSFFKSIWDTIAGIFKVVKSVLTGNWKDAWEGIKGIVNTWVGFFKNVWENIKKVFSAVKEFFKTVFTTAWDAIKKVFSGWVGFFRDLWGKIKNTFSNIGKNIANAIGGAVKQGINGVINMIEGTINTAINLINGAIKLINMIPGVGIGELGHVKLPRLAKGGVLENGARTVIAGENGAEAIVPLEKNTKWISLVANQLQKQMMPQLSSNTGAYSEMRAQTEFNSLVNSFKQALSEMKVVMDEETFGKFVDRTVSDAIYD